MKLYDSFRLQKTFMMSLLSLCSFDINWRAGGKTPRGVFLSRKKWRLRRLFSAIGSRFIPGRFIPGDLKLLFKRNDDIS